MSNSGIDSKGLVSVIKQNRSKRVAAAAIIEGGRHAATVVAKLNTDKNEAPPTDDKITQNRINRAALEGLYSKMAAVRTNNKHIISLFPDIELAIQILVSSILSPKKMTDIQLNYRFHKKFTLDSTLSAGLLESIQNYVEENYELEDSLPNIVREALFTSGSCVYAVISEAAIDEVINSDLIAGYSTEEFKTAIDKNFNRILTPINLIRPKGLVQPTGKKTEDIVSLEDLAELLVSSDSLSIHDNPNVVRFGDLTEKISAAVFRKDMRANGVVSTESIEKVDYMDLFRVRGRTGDRQIEYINTPGETYRKSVGKPLVLRLPSGSVIPASTPGNEEDHMGYLVLLDENFRPISNDSGDNDINRLNQTLHGGNNRNSLIQKAYDNLIASTSNSNVDINSLFDVYKNILERQLFNTVKATLNGKSVSLAEKNDIYFTMFSRALQDQRTSILYLRKESVVYYAFQYNELGIGKSLLDNMAIQASMRAILLFARIMAEAKQSIDVTRVNVEFDPEDPDPEKTAETIQSSILKLRQNFMPLGINNPIDLINWVQRCGLQFNYTNHPMFPTTNITFENGGTQHTVPSSDLEEELRKQSIIALGLPPETVDNGFSPEFARSVINNNILLSKRVGVYQKRLNADVTKFVNILIQADEDLRTLIKSNIESKINLLQESLSEEEKNLLNKDREAFMEYYVDLIGDKLSLELPKPEETNITNLAAEYDLYKDNLAKVLDSVISSEIFSDDVIGDISNNIDSIKNVYMHYLLRKWMSDNNFYPEVLDITNTDKEEAKVLLETINSHLTYTGRNSVKLFSMMKDVKAAIDADLAEAFDGEEQEGSESSYTPSSSSDTESSDNPDEDNPDSDLGDDGLDDFNLNL